MSRDDATTEFPMLLRLGPGGGILRSEGADEELAAVVANARRLGRLAGQLMGMDPFVAMECSLASGRQPFARQRLTVSWETARPAWRNFRATRRVLGSTMPLPNRPREGRAHSGRQTHTDSFDDDTV